MLPERDEERKAVPIDAIFKFWPDSLIELAKHIQSGNDKYNKGNPVEWQRHLSSDHKGSAFRHQIDRVKAQDIDEVIAAQVAIVWREMAQLQLDCEERDGGKSDARPWLTQEEVDRLNRLWREIQRTGDGFDVDLSKRTDSV